MFTKCACVQKLRAFWRPETGIFLMLWLGLLVSGRSSLFHDPGTFWHTVVGDRILSTGQLIYTDPFSFTFAGRPWIAHQWLGECLMAAVDRLDGFDSLLLASATLLAALYTWVAHRLLRSGLHWSLTCVFVLLIVAASSQHFHVRPHLATIVGIAVTVVMLVDFEAGRRSLRQMFWLIPVYVLWTNIHGGMLGGLCTIGIAIVGWTTSWRLGRASPITGWKGLGAISTLLLACALTAFVNPYGWRLPWTWVSIMDSPLLPHIIREHAPLDVTKPFAWCVLVLGLLYVAALLSALPRLRVSWLLPLVWLALGCTRVRHAPLFAITAALATADVLPHTRWVAWLRARGSDWFRAPNPDGRAPRSGFQWAIGPVTLILIAICLQAVHASVPVIGHGWARLDTAEWPTALLGDLQAAASKRSKPARIFNEYADGGFLIYYTPGFRVFVDDRCELYGDNWLREYVQAESGDVARWMHSWQMQYGDGHAEAFEYALTRSGSAFDKYFGAAGNWTEVRRTPTATLYHCTDVATIAIERELTPGPFHYRAGAASAPVTPPGSLQASAEHGPP